MPTYEYECRKCKHRFEKFQSMNDAPLKKCPDCGGELRRLIGRGSGIIFKGPGFYATDHRKPDKNAGSKGEKPADSIKSDKNAGSKKEEPSNSAGSKENLK